MQCRCRKIIIARKVVNNITDPDMRNICQHLMQGLTLKAVRDELDMHIAVFDMFVREISRLLLEAGIQVRGV